MGSTSLATWCIKGSTFNDCLVKLTKLTLTSEFVDLISSSMDCFESLRLLKKNDTGITGIYEKNTQIRKCDPHCTCNHKKLECHSYLKEPSKTRYQK